MSAIISLLCLCICLSQLTLGLTQVSSSDSEPRCVPWKQQEGQPNKIDGRKFTTSPTCAKPVSLLAEGQFSSGIASPSSPLLPPWFNATSFRAGQQFASKHIMGMIISTIYALSMFSSIPDASSVVFHTNHANTPSGANRRHLATMLQFKVWLEDMAGGGDEELSPRLVKSLMNVREIHSKVAAKLNHKMPRSLPMPSNFTHAYMVDKSLWAALATDLRNSKIPAAYRTFPREMHRVLNNTSLVAFNHLGMSAIQWALIGPMFLSPHECGVWRASHQEWTNYLHFWATLSYALGMSDEYNIALQPDLDSARAYFLEFYDSYFLPSMFYYEHDEQGQILWECFFEGPSNLFLGSSAPFYFRKEQVMIFILETFMKIPAPALRAKLKASGSGSPQLPPLSMGFERLLPLYQFESVRKAGVWALNNFFLRPDAKRVFGIESNDMEQVVEYAYTGKEGISN